MRKFSILIVTFFLVLSCTSKKGAVTSKREISEEDYYLTFTEATKYTMLGNIDGDFSSYKRAIKLYNLCIQEFPEKAASYYQVSNIYLSANDIVRAKSYAIKAVELEDSNKWYLMQLANIYQYEQNLDSLIYLYEKLIVITDNPEYKYNLALFYNANSEFDKSMHLAKSLESSFEGSRELYLIRHRNFAAMNEPDSAIFELERLIDNFPDQYENYGMLAEYLSEINKYEESQKVYLKLLRQEPTNGLANLSYGDFFIKQGLKDSALYYYERGFEAKDISLEDKIGIVYNYMYEGTSLYTDSVFIPSLIHVLTENYSDSRPYALAAEYYIKKQDYKSASVELKNAINAKNNDYVVWEQFIMISNFLGHNEDVKAYYKEAIAKFPNEINLYIFSGYSLYLLEEYESIIELKDSALQIEVIEKEQKIQYLNLLADSYRGINELEISDSLYEEILVIDPENLLIRNNYSYYLSVRNKDLDRAEELSRLTVRREPKNATYLDTYGWILFKKGETKEALKYVEAAIKNGAYNNGEVLDHYGDIMSKLGRCNEAIEAWNEAIKYDVSLEVGLKEKIKNIDISACED